MEVFLLNLQPLKLSSPDDPRFAFEFSSEAKMAVYEAIYRRRDVRHFRSDPIPTAVLARILHAAHHAPSVGFMQPWNFLLVYERTTREKVADLFRKENQAAALFFEDERAQQYQTLKLEGISESALNIVVTCDPTRGGRVVLGRNSIPETDVYSTSCAVQNLWLAARAEGIGVGWVSILKNSILSEIFNIPPHIIPVAYLCLGYVDEFFTRPELERVGWAERLPTNGLIFWEKWGQKDKTMNTTTLIQNMMATIRPLDFSAIEAARARQLQLTKPTGALGRLETLSIQLAGITGQLNPSLKRKHIILCAGDHGVAAEGVSAYPAEVTPQMVLNFLNGGAAINVLARQMKADVTVVDMGVASDLPPHDNLVQAKVAYGTQNMAHGPAMSREQALQAIATGSRVVNELVEQGGLDLVVLGEMGIANTTPAAAIGAVITGHTPKEITGRGTGVNDEQLAHKINVIKRALTLNQPDPSDAIDVLAKVGGFEIGGLVGVCLAAAAQRIPIIVDGFITTSAALLAVTLAPAVKPYLIAAHRSQEQGHRLLLAHMGLEPLLDLDLRLGEGSGGALAISLIEAAVGTLNEMATFAEAGVSDKEE